MGLLRDYMEGKLKGGDSGRSSGSDATGSSPQGDDGGEIGDPIEAKAKQRGSTTRPDSGGGGALGGLARGIFRRVTRR